MDGKEASLTNVQANLSAGGFGFGVGSTGMNICRQMDVTILSGEKYLITGSFNTFSGKTSTNNSSMYLVIGQQSQTASPTITQSQNITTNSGVLNSPLPTTSTGSAIVK